MSSDRAKQSGTPELDPRFRTKVVSTAVLAAVVVTLFSPVSGIGAVVSPLGLDVGFADVMILATLFGGCMSAVNEIK